MKKSLFALAALGAFAGAAQAQSSVSIYGNLDYNVISDNVNGNSNLYSGTSNNSTSLWGLKGSEDLGGGLKMGFDLKSEIGMTTGQTGNASNAQATNAVAGSSTSGVTASTIPAAAPVLTGQTGQLFNRGANFFLSSNSLGELKFGRQDDIMWAMSGTFSTSDSNSFGSNTMNAAMNNVSAIGALNGGATCSTGTYNTIGGVCSINSTSNTDGISGASTAFTTGIRYTSPVVYGFKASAFTSVGQKNIAGSEGQFSSKGAGLEYTYGDLRLGTAITERSDNLGLNAVYGVLAAAQYQYGKLRFTGNYQTWSYNNGWNGTSATGITTSVGQSGLNGYSLGINYQTSANTDVSLAYTSMQDNVTSTNSATMWGLTGRYNFSKRTQAYAGAGIVNNSGNAYFSPLYGGMAYSLAAAGGQTATAYMVGLKHSF